MATWKPESLLSRWPDWDAQGAHRGSSDWPREGAVWLWEAGAVDECGCKMEFL